jgi:hypothetical protein
VILPHKDSADHKIVVNNDLEKELPTCTSALSVLLSPFLHEELK